MKTLFLLLLITFPALADKRIIRDIPTGVHLAPPGTVLYDGLEDFLTHNDFDHTGAKYVSINQPVWEMQEIDGVPTNVKISDETVIIPVHPSVFKRHTFGGWKAEGKKVPE